MSLDKIPMRSREERSIPQSEHEPLETMAKAYVEQHLSFRKQLADKIGNDEARQLHEKVRKIIVLLRKLGNLRHDHYDTLVDLDQTRSRIQRLQMTALLVALAFTLTLTLGYFGIISITPTELKAFINLQASTTNVLVGGGVIYFGFQHFHRVRVEDLRDHLVWRMDAAASEIELITSRLSLRYRTVWEWADLLYMHSCIEGEKRHAIGFIDRQARRKRLRSHFDIGYYGFYPEATFMASRGLDPRTPPSLDLLIECKLFISLLFNGKAHYDLCNEWQEKGLETPEDTIQDYSKFQRNYQA